MSCDINGSTEYARLLSKCVVTFCSFSLALAGDAGFKVGVLTLKNNTHNNNIPPTQQNNPRKSLKKMSLPLRQTFNDTFSEIQ